jgi:hypothetical protein
MDKDLYLRITRPQNVCVKCGAAIAEAGKHLSAIFAAGPPMDAAPDDDDEGVLRQDFCPACWEEIRGTDYFSFWLARREKPKPRKIQNRKERNTMLLSYFDHLYQEASPDNGQHLYFLAHLLMKFSVFRWVRNEPPAAEGLPGRVVFRNTATDDFVTVEEVVMDEERLVAIKRGVDEFLSRALTEDPGAQNPPAESGAADTPQAPDSPATPEAPEGA